MLLLCLQFLDHLVFLLDFHLPCIQLVSQIANLIFLSLIELKAHLSVLLFFDMLASHNRKAKFTISLNYVEEISVLLEVLEVDLYLFTQLLIEFLKFVLKHLETIYASLHVLNS